VQRIGWRIGHLIHGAINGHQPQAEGERSFGPVAGERTTTLPEELAHHRDAQVLSPCAQGAPGRQGDAGVRPDPAQAPAQMGKDFRHVELPEQGQCYHILHHHQLAELAFSLFPGVTLG